MSLPVRQNGRTRFLSRWIAIGWRTLLFSAVFASPNFGQEPMPTDTSAATPLAQLLQEVEQNNPQIQAARHGWKAAQQVPRQVSTLPDPQFQLQ